MELIWQQIAYEGAHSQKDRQPCVLACRYPVLQFEARRASVRLKQDEVCFPVSSIKGQDNRHNKSSHKHCVDPSKQEFVKLIQTKIYQQGAAYRKIKSKWPYSRRYSNNGSRFIVVNFLTDSS